MKRFIALFQELDATTKTNAKVAAMVRYFDEAPAQDAVWALYLLAGRRPKRPVNVTKLTLWAQEFAGLPEWLLGECYDAVGDMAETLAKVVLPDVSLQSGDQSLHTWIEERFLPLRELEEAEQRRVVEAAWRELDEDGRFIWNKLITGSFRVGVSQDLVVRALAEATGNPVAIIAHRLMGDWIPSPELFQGLFAAQGEQRDPAHPYPFALAHPLQAEPDTLGNLSDWLAEWKYDGIRCQLIRRQGATYLWSRGEEPIAQRFPEVGALGDLLPDGSVLDGEIMAWRDGPLPFAELQKRIGRKEVGKKLLADVPCALVGFDVLEWAGQDIRSRPLSERRAALIECASLLAQSTAFAISIEVVAEGWDELRTLRAESRGRRVEGLMLKRRDSTYPVGRKRGQWWKWKIEPHTVDAVLMYAQRGSGIRASLYTDYTFGIWKDGALVPFAKAYSGLNNQEIGELDQWIRGHTLEKFGPVRTVEPFHVFELAFEGIQLSKRHKSGIAVRFPRILRWRRDKSPDQADTYETVAELL